MKIHPFLLAAFFLNTPITQAASGSAECRQVPNALHTLSSPDADGEVRSRVGTCLLRAHLDAPEVNRAVLRILRDPAEDILLKEDLIDAFAEGPLRRKYRIEGQLAPKLGPQEREAVDRTVAGASSLLAAAQAVRSIEETVPASPQEAEFFRVLSEIALDDTSHVLLRASAVNALEKISVKVVDSGVFDEKNMRLVRETLRTVAARDDSASYFTNASVAYNRLAIAGLPGFSRDLGVPSAPAGGTNSRMISSVQSEK